jgi:hypothetical protein
MRVVVDVGFVAVLAFEIAVRTVRVFHRSMVVGVLVERHQVFDVPGFSICGVVRDMHVLVRVHDRRVRVALELLELGHVATPCQRRRWHATVDW